MSKEVATQAHRQLPAYLQKFAPVDAGAADKWGSGQKSGFPVISTKSKVFHIKRGDELELVANPADPDEPASNIAVVVLDTHPGTAKTFYAGRYVEGSDDKPTCYSNDGIHPAADAVDRQFKNCALCPRNQWGSRLTEDGKKAKECSDVKRLAVAPVGLLNDPMLLRVPPTSLKTWDAYVSMLGKRGYLPEHMVTKISFDHTVSHQALLFKPTGFVTEEMIEPLIEAREGSTIKSIIGGDTPTGAAEPDMDDDEVLDKSTGEVSKKKPVVDPEFDDEFEEEEPPKKPAKRAPRKKAEKAPEPAKAAKPALVEDDFFDDDVDEAPQKPAAKAAKKAAVVDVEADEGAEDDLDFDDLDFDD